MLLTKTICHMHHTKASIHILCMHSAVAWHNDMCKQPVILGDGPNLCFQAETDMITTDEGRYENGGSDTNVVL